jgi:hypothetical protein
MDKEIFERGMSGAREYKASKVPGARFFDETMLHPKATAIDAPKFIEFDWELLRRALGEARDEMSETDYELLAQVLRELLRWIVKGSRLALIGRRAVALAWVVNPDILEGDSLTKIAKRVLCQSVRLHQLSGEVSRTFNARNRSQAHASNWKPISAAPKTGKRAKKGAKKRL